MIVDDVDLFMFCMASFNGYMGIVRLGLNFLIIEKM